jgi:peroxiredoxin
MVEIGSAAPAFTLIDTTRTATSLGDFAGKKVVIAFFPGAFTGVCTKEMCTFQDSMTALNGLNAAVLGISIDTPFASAEFAAKNKITYPLLCDLTHSVTKAYGVEFHNFAGVEGYSVAQRSVFVLDQAGIVRYKWVAENPGIEPDYAAVIAAVEAIA